MNNYQEETKSYYQQLYKKAVHKSPEDNFSRNSFDERLTEQNVNKPIIKFNLGNRLIQEFTITFLLCVFVFGCKIINTSQSQYAYKYANQEIKAKEDKEREVYRAEYITPLTKRIKELKDKVYSLENSLCIAIWGFSKEEYYLRKRLASAEEELAYQLSYVENLREELKKFTLTKDN